MSALIYSCGSNDESAKKDEPKPDTATAPTPTTGNVTVANEKGLELIGSSDCTTCHAIDRKIIGPSYQDVANKYENTDKVIDTLISKIKKGGMGNWGNVPMTPHPDVPDS